MKIFLSLILCWVNILFFLFLTSCSVIPPQEEHYMLRADYYRALEEQRKTSEAEKTALRERIINVQSELAREEGRKIQTEDELVVLRKDLSETRMRLDSILQKSEEESKGARTELEQSLLAVERLQKELETTRSELSARAAEINDLKSVRETTVVLIRNISFSINSAVLTSLQKKRLSSLKDLFNSADHVSIVGHAERRERGNLWLLSSQRASVVAKYLITSLRIPSSKITVVGQSAEASASDLSSNRRVEIIVINKSEL
ncbi:MAG: hypothetical protein COS94_09200 [Candidatus Hydrogenedentes bacterium CG07_land_8_20_14_0_80_42_17]|nr:MAG: hypothetical protein COS94_09200 [Candidatus Hydrogenedentes bacterium CG07_land_8_20_14_0_80_42_17]